MSSLTIDVRRVGTVSVIDISGKLTMEHGTQLEDAFGAELAWGATHVVLNLKQVPWMDSSGLGSMIACRNRAAARGIEVRVVLSPRSRQILTLANVLFEFIVFEDMESALASFVAS